MFVDDVAERQAAVAPDSSRQACLLAAAGGVGEENLCCYGKHLRIGKAFEEGSEKAFFHSHVIVEQDNDGVAGVLETGVRTAAESPVLIE